MEVSHQKYENLIKNINYAGNQHKVTGSYELADAQFWYI